MRLFWLSPVLMDISVDGGPGPGLQSLWPSLTSLIVVVVACGTRHWEPTGRSILIQDRFRATPKPIDNKKFTYVWPV